MGRKPLPPSQRAQPISFSLKPHLIEKIDDYAADLRFSRSKFLMEAVTQYILKADMGYMAASNNVNDMTLAQKVAVGLAALQEANREGETISKPVMDALRREIGQFDYEESINPQPITGEFTWKRVSDKQFVNYGDHHADFQDFDSGAVQSTALSLTKKGRKWVSPDPRYITAEPLEFKTLAEAKSKLEELYLYNLNNR